MRSGDIETTEKFVWQENAVFAKLNLFTPLRYSLSKACIRIASSLLLLSAQFSYASDTIFTAVYASEYSGMDIEITRTLESLGKNQYSYNFDADSTIARIKESSKFSIVEGRFQPLHYSYERKVFGFGDKETVNFDWNKKQASYYEGKKKEHTHAIQDDVLDSSLYQLQLQKDLFHQQQQFNYRYIQRDKLKERSFRVTGKTTYQVNGKTYPALTVKRDSNDPKVSTEIIVIPELYYLIAQIEQEKDGSVFQTSLKSVNLHGDKLAKLYQ